MTMEDGKTVSMYLFKGKGKTQVSKKAQLQALSIIQNNLRWQVGDGKTKSMYWFKAKGSTQVSKKAQLSDFFANSMRAWKSPKLKMVPQSCDKYHLPNLHFNLGILDWLVCTESLNGIPVDLYMCWAG